MNVSERRSKLAILGPFPPPRHGVSTVNEAVFLMVERAGIKVVRLDTAPDSLSRGLLVKLKRCRRVLRAAVGLVQFARANVSKAAYLSLSGGLGILYETAAVLLARWGGAAIIVHHHSFRYIDRYYWPMHLLTITAGGQALHVVLADEMGAKLRQRYASIGATLVVSNAWIVNDRAGASGYRQGIRRIGYMANISSAKGIFDVLEFALLSDAANLGVEFAVAGPFEDEAVKEEFQLRLKHLKNVVYIGPVYREKKQAFLEEIDLLIFPTRYRNEAEPIVVLEALGAGCPVIAFARGCIPFLLSAGAGVAVPCHENFAARALAEVQLWQSNPTKFLGLRKAARERFTLLQGESRRASEHLLEILIEPTKMLSDKPETSTS